MDFKKTLLFLSLLLSPIASIADVTMGGVYGSSKAFILGDYNLFDQETKVLGVVRYGGGSSRIEIGNGLGVNLTATTGIVVNQFSDHLIEPIFALEILSGSLIANTNDYIEDYYQWLPALSLGPQLNFLGLKVLTNFKAGLSISNLGKDGVLPMFHNTFGVGLYINDYIAGNYYIIGDNYIRNLELTNNLFCVRLEDKKGTLEEKNILLMLRIKD